MFLPRTSSLVASVLTVALAVGGCAGEDSGAAASGPPAVDAGSDTSAHPGFDAAVDSTDTGTCYIEPGADSDGDGLPDIVEDANRDCRRTPDETDPYLADTDGDGLGDGEEDIDGNGRWDAERGELDPRNADTDGDGRPDGEEPEALVCTSSLLDDAMARRRSNGGVDVLLPPASLGVPASGDRWLLARGEDRWLMHAEGHGLAQSLVDGPDAALVAARPHQAGWRAIYSIPATPFDALDRVAAELGVVVDYVSDSDWSSEAALVQVDADFSGAAPRWSIASVGESVDDWQAWFDASTTAAVVDSDAARTLPACEAGTRIAPSPAVELVVVVDSSEDARPGVADAFDALVDAVLARESAGLRTRVRLVTGADHLDETSTALAPDTLRSAVELAAAFAALPPGESDQRLWSAARDALAASQAEDMAESVPPILVVISGREDTEFRNGTYLGRDGHPLADPLEEGPQREGLVEYYASQLPTEAMVAVRTGACESKGMGWSLRGVAMAGGGLYVDACSEAGAQVLRDAIARRLPTESRLELSRSVLAGSARLVGVDGTSDFERSPTEAGMISSSLDVAVGYLYSEQASTPR